MSDTYAVIEDQAHNYKVADQYGIVEAAGLTRQDAISYANELNTEARLREQVIDAAEAAWDAAGISMTVARPIMRDHLSMP